VLSRLLYNLCTKYNTYQITTIAIYIFIMFFGTFSLPIPAAINIITKYDNIGIAYIISFLLVIQAIPL